MRQILLYIFILFVCSVSAESFKITGRVVDAAEGNEPLIGAAVEIKGTNRRTATDMDGNFGIEVEKGTILRFSYVGSISKEVEVLDDSSLVIKLEIDTTHIVPEEIYMKGTGSSLCPCPHHTMIRERAKFQNRVRKIKTVRQIPQRLT